MTDFFETLGEIAKPIKPVLDFALPDAAGQSEGGLINALSQGVSDAVMESGLGLLRGAQGVISGDGMSARERLLYGGLIAGGAAMSARAAHRRWKMNRPVDFRPARSGSRELIEELGDRDRFMLKTPEAEELSVRRPGTNRRQLQILAAEAEVEAAIGFGRWKSDDVQKLADGAAIVRQLAQRSGGLADAQVMLARFDQAMQSKKFPATVGTNGRVRELWKQVTENPTELLKDPAATEEILSVVQEFAEMTDGLVGDDLSVGLAGRVDMIEMTDQGMQIHVAHPRDWGDGRHIDKKVRTQRLQQLNYRSLAAQGYENLKRIYLLGKSQFEAGSPLFQSTKMLLGPDWYPGALKDVRRVFSIDESDAEATSRAVAAVSFLSEAEDWSDNIVKARDVLNHAGDVSDVDFQNWLRNEVTLNVKDPKTKYTYEGVRASEHHARFDEIWETVRKAGFKVQESDMKKVLRLYGGVETVADVFRSTAARKQKNFYLNIRYPELEYPVTIDRHAFDAFLGLDSGVDKRPIDKAMFDGDEVYDVIADTYRALADDLGVHPHALQAVIWEAWRAMKADSHSKGWSTNAPFMIHPEGGINPVFEVLSGQGSLPASLNAPAGPVPLSVLGVQSVGDLTSTVTPSGSVVVSTDVTDATATAARAMTPGIIGDDKVPRWVPVRPRRFRDYLEYVKRRIVSPTAHVETFLADELAQAGGHPVMKPGNWIVATLPDGAKIASPKGLGRITPLGRSSIERPERLMDRLGVEDLDPEIFQDPGRSPLKTHQWAAISAALSDEQVSAMKIGDYTLDKATADLHRELVAKGFKPIPQRGVYGGYEEPSFLVFGISPEEAASFGERFGQDSVITNDGLVYNRRTPNDPSNAGMASEVRGFEFTSNPDNMSEIVIGGQTVRWNADVDWDQVEPAPNVLGRTSTSTRRVEIEVRDSARLAELADELEARGASDLAIYSSAQELPGWERAYEEIASDGLQTVVTRWSDGNPASPHGGHVFLRNAKGLPKHELVAPSPADPVGGVITIGGLQIDGNFGRQQVDFSDGPFSPKLDGQKPVAFGYTDSTLTPIFDQAELNSGRFDVIVRANGEIEALNTDDLTPAVWAKQDLVEAGFEETLPKGKKLTLKSGGRKFNFPNEKDFGKRSELVTTKNGLIVPAGHRDRPKTEFAERFGFEFDPGYMKDRQVREIDPVVQNRISEVTETFMADHALAVQRFRLPKVTVDQPDDRAVYAMLEYEAGGKIVLARDWWDDIPTLEKALSNDRSRGWLSPRVAGGPETILAHEYGHVLHGALASIEGFKGSLDFEKELRQILGSRWKSEAKKKISETAAIDVSELIAEAYTEVMHGAPSDMSLNVYDYVQDRLSSGLRFQQAVNW